MSHSPFKNLKFKFRSMDKKFILLAFVSLFLFSGCIGTEEIFETDYTNSGSGTSYYSKEAPAPMMAEAAMDYGGYGYDDEYAYASEQQMVIKQGSATIKVETGTLDEKKNQLNTIMDQYNAETSSVWFNEYSTEKQYAVTLKIAPTKFDSFMESLSALGEIKSIDASSDDVTEQYTDLQTRITNLEEELARLNALYSEADNVEEILMIEREVTRVQTQLEIYQARALNLERSSSQSTITVYLIEEKPELQTDFLLPLEEIVALFLGALSAAILLIVGALGFLIPLAILFVILRAIYLALRKKKPKKA